jgi:hypothetical protein
VLLFLIITIHFSNEILKITGKQKHQKNKKIKKEMRKQFRGISENRYHKQDENTLRAFDFSKATLPACFNVF